MDGDSDLFVVLTRYGRQSTDPHNRATPPAIARPTNVANMLTAPSLAPMDALRSLSLTGPGPDLFKATGTYDSVSVSLAPTAGNPRHLPSP